MRGLPLYLNEVGGFTLLEAAATLVILGITLAGLLPAARRQLDRSAVLGAREDVAGLFHQARFEAVAHGGATVRLETDPASARLLAGGAVVATVALAAEYQVSLALSRDRSEAELTFDPLGLGRVASQTLRFARGEAEAGLVVSAYGRVVRE